MKNKAVDASSHPFSDKDEILVDANIWIYLCSPGGIPGSWQVKTYSSIMARILKAGSKLFLDVLVLSEYINRYSRIAMNHLQPAQTNFKAFRNSPDYPPVASAIEAEVKQLLMVCTPVNHAFDEWNLNDLMTDFGANSVDCNDQLITENCKKNGFSLLTNDGDFTEGGIPVLTANNKLLTACP